MLMATTVVLLASWILGWIWASSGRIASTTSAVFVGLLGFYGLRSAVLATGLDDPFPDYLFGRDWSTAVSQANLTLAVWILIFTAVLVIPRRSRRRPFYLVRCPPIVLRRAAAITTAVGSAIFLLIVASVGSLAATQTELRTGDTSLAVLSVPTQAAMLLSACACYSASSRQQRVVSVLLWALNALLLFGWGARSPLLISLVVVILMTADRRRGSGVPNTQRSHPVRTLSIAAVGAVVVLAAALGLRMVRDVTLGGGQLASQSDVSVVETLSRASNATMFDAYSLAVRDFDESYEHVEFDLFGRGAVGLVPRALWADKPNDVAPGKWFRRLYEPTRIGGWPVWAPGEWWISFGAFGLGLGAALSGLLVAAVDPARGREVSQRAKVLALLWGFLLVPTGLHVQLPTRLVMWWVVPTVAARIVHLISYRNRNAA